MHGKTRFLALAVLIFVAAFGANSQQRAQEGQVPSSVTYRTITYYE